MKHRTTLVLACAANAMMAQSPIPPPVSTDLNNGVPGTWTISTMSATGWTWGATVGTAGSGGLIMDCGTCMGYEETTIWSPWLDLSSSPPIDVTFNCAIIGGSMLLPPPVWIRRDDQSGPEYLYRYGPPDLIPPPDEVIPSTINPFPPLDLNTVQWVSITYPYLGPAQNDSVRIGIGTGVPLGGYALVDDIAIGGLATAVATSADTHPVVMQSSEAITVRSAVPLRAVDVLDLAGRVVIRTPLQGEREYTLRTQTLPEGAYLLRLQHGTGQAVVRVAW